MEYNLRSLRLLLLFILCFFGTQIYFWGQNIDDELVLYGQDVRIEASKTLQGYFLYVRKKPSISSVLLTESTETISTDDHTYAFRTPTFNGINGNEKRVLNGRFIQAKSGFFLVDSTPEPDAAFGSAFVLFIPFILEFGYESTRNGVIDIQTQDFPLSIRTFEQPYADYAGAYVDNLFYLQKIENIANDYNEDIPKEAVQIPPDFLPENQVAESSQPAPAPAPTPTPTSTSTSTVNVSNSISDALDGITNIVDDDKYSPDTVASFSNIAERTGSNPVYVENKNDIIDKIGSILDQLPKDKSSDVLILLDTTRSMWDDLAVLKSRLIPTISKIMQGKIYRLGLVLYRDEGEDYVTKKIEFDDQLEIIQRTINSVQAGGGNDWPEAVYEAFSVGVNDYTWIAENRVIFIVGDAPPHEPPNTKVDLDELYAVTANKKIAVYPLILPRRE